MPLTTNLAERKYHEALVVPSFEIFQLQTKSRTGCSKGLGDRRRPQLDLLRWIKWIYSSLIPSPHFEGSSSRQESDSIGLTLLPDARNLIRSMTLT